MNQHIKRELYAWTKSILFALCIVFICRQFIFTPITVQGESMLPTFDDNNRVIVSKTSHIERFDMVVFHAPDAELNYIKRVIGVPGDQLEMIDDVLYINGKAYEEPYVNRNTNSHINKVTGDFTLQELTGKKIVPKGYLFVLGDNRSKSNDSRIFGFISEDSMIGEVKFQFYPLKEIGIPK